VVKKPTVGVAPPVEQRLVPTAAQVALAARAEELAAFVDQGVARVLGVEAARLAGLLGGVSHQVWRWYATPWTPEDIKHRRQYQAPTSKDRAAIERVLALLERRFLPGGPEEGGIAIMALERLLGEIYIPLALGSKGHDVKPWSVDARRIAEEILKVRQELDRRIDRRTGHHLREKLDDAEVKAAASFIHKLFSRFGDASRHGWRGKPPSRDNILFALKNPPRE
jgi:hypothetical protein